MRSILCVILETSGGIARPASLEMRDKAQSLAESGHMELRLLPCEERSENRAAALLLPALLRMRPDVLLLAGTLWGRCVAPLLAAKLGAGLTADCTELRMEGGLLRATRPAFGGSLLAEIICERARPQMATAREHAFGAGFAAGGLTLADARVILAGGRGLGKAGFVKLRRCAAYLGAAVGASRGAVDLGLAPYAEQIGQTGVTVRPALYVAFGISGAVQHLLGARNAGSLIAVNMDARAPIFDYADEGVIADCESVIDAIIHTREEMS